MYPKIVIIGSTGKLGSKLLDYTHKNNISISAITCFKNKKKILTQNKKYGVSKNFILSDPDDHLKFIKFLKNKINIIYFLYISRKPCRLPGLNMHLYTASGLASAPEHAAVGYLRTVDLHRTNPQCLSHRTRKLPAFQTVCSAFGASSSSPRISELDFSSS